MASETMRRLDEIVGAFREGVIVRVSCGGMLCGECIQCTARAAKASLQREQRAAQDEIARLARELEAARERERVNRLAAIVALSSAESVISWAITHYVRFGRMDNTLGQVRVALRILGEPPVDSHTVTLLMDEPSWSFGEAVRRALAADTEEGERK